MKVKICGITNLDDALVALHAGADLLGFNFYPKSPRYVSLEACAAMTRELRRRGCKATLVGVFVNPSQAEVERALRTCDLDLAQLSGDESPEFVQSLGARAFKALRPANAPDGNQALRAYSLRSLAPAMLLDAHRPGAYGGTGQTADWSLARELAGRVPLLLAGGLTAENVAAAIQQVQPWGVDVASGVESAPGRKDPLRMVEFIQTARNYGSLSCAYPA
jgi:phosphoribosylanthranilate isomerase